MNQAIKIIDEMTEVFKYKSRNSTTMNDYSAGYRDAMIEIKEKLSSLPSDTQWIDVKEQYPEDNTRVLVNNGEYTDTCQGFASEYSGDWIWNSSIRYTHWMPLPTPPNN